MFDEMLQIFLNVSKLKNIQTVYKIRKIGCIKLKLTFEKSNSTNKSVRFNKSDDSPLFIKCTFILPINRGASHQPYLYQLFGVVLKSVEQEKYLGVILSHNLTWRSHINAVAT